MPKILPTDWANEVKDEITERGRGRYDEQARSDLISKISAAEDEGLGVVPTSVVYAGALAATDDKESARWATIIARKLDLPAPPGRHVPTRAGRPKGKPESQIDPYTGKAISLQRAKQLYGIGGQIATLLEGYRPHRGYTPPDPGNVAAIVRATELVGDVAAERALAFAIDADRTDMPIERFRGNLAIINGWNENTGTITDEEALIYARWWAENKDRPITPGDLVTITTPELTAAIKQKRGAVNTNPYANFDLAEANPNATPEQIAASHQFFYGELDSLVAARDKAISDPRYLDDAKRILQEVDAPDWADRAIAWSGDQLEQMWKVTQHVFVDVSTVGVGAVDIAQGLVPGGQTVGDAIRETQRERQYIIQRINGGDSVGTIYAEDSFLPTWAAPAFDFAVGWAFDPFILGGKLATGIRAGRVVPGVLDAQTVVGRVAAALTPTRVSNWWERLRLSNYGGVVTRFSSSSSSRKLFEAAYKLDDGEEMTRVITRLANNVEARSALEYEYMNIARAELLAKYPQASEKAWAEWQEIMRGHFDVPVSQGSVAERVNAIRNGTQVEFAERALARPQTFIMGRPMARESIDDIITDGTSPLLLRNEVPHGLVPVPGFGAGKLASLRFGESRLGQSDLGSSIRSIFNVNPGAVLRPGDNAELFFLRKGTRWRTFTEPELRNFQVRATEITTSGVSVNTRMRALLEEMDRTAMRRIANRIGMDESLIDDAIDNVTFGSRKLNDQTTFGITKQTALQRTEAFRPLTETHLTNEIVSMDPVLIRKFFKRYNDTFLELSKAAAKHGLPDVGAIAIKSKDVANDILLGAMRTWKLLVVPRPAYIGRVILLDENLRFMSTTMSLMERLVSFELKKGIRGLVGKGASKLLDDEIRVGTEVIPLPRAGGFGYEPLANQAFHTEEALDDLLRHAGLRDRSLETLGHWGAIQPNDVQHPVMWMRALNFQLGNSVPGRIALASVSRRETLEETIGALRRWGSRDGYTMLRSELGIGPDDVDEWAEALAGMTHGYTMGDPALAAAANTRAITEDMLSVYRPVEGAADVRPVIHGPLIEALTGAGGHARTGFGLRRLTNRVWDTFVRTPENVLNRQPYYRVWKRRATQAHLKALDEAGYGTTAKPLTPELLARVDQSSREFALAQVKKIMFDFTENTRFGEMASAIFPFFQPWAEAYQVWGHILLKRNPAMIGYVAQTWRTAEQAGVIKRDENGQWVMPWSFFSRAYSMLPWLGGKELPEGLGMVAPLSSLNLFLSNSVELGGFPVPVPGLSPWAAIPLKALFRDTQNPHLISYLFAYGPETPLVSRWMENTLRKWFPEEFHDDRQVSVAQDFLRLYQYLGTDRDENGDPLPASVLKARALEDARQVSGMLGTIGFFAPTTGRLTFPEGYEDAEEELDELRDTLGFEAGTDAFLAKHPDLTLMTVGKTVTTRMLDGETAPRLPQSEDVQRLFQEPGFARFAKRFPAWTGLLVLSQDEEWDESSLAVYSDQIQDGSIKYKGLDRFYTDGQVSGFWNAVDAMYAHLNPRADLYEAQGLSDDNAKVQELATQKAEMLYHILLRYPQYAAKQGIRENTYIEGQAIWDGDEGTPPSEIVLHQAQQITELEGFQEFPAIQGLKAYLDLRQQMQHKMEAIAVDDIGSTTSERVGLTAEWENGKAAILSEFPETEPFINAFFDDDLEGLPSKAERTLLKMRAEQPDRYESYLRADTKLEDLADAALEQDSGDQRSTVYNDQAAYIDALYDNGNAWKLRLWFDRKDRSSQVSYMEAVQARPPVFYTRFDWELMGVKLTKNAAAILSSYRDAREEIDARSAAEVRGGPEFLSGNAYESVDRQMAAYARKDKSLRRALDAMRSFGYGLFNSLPAKTAGFSYVDQKGKAGYAWRYVADLTSQVNDAIIKLGWHGPDSFDSDSDKQNYVETRDSLFDAVEEFMKWSPTFRHQWYDFQRTQLRGDPVIEWIMPDTYFPIGIVGED